MLDSPPPPSLYHGCVWVWVWGVSSYATCHSYVFWSEVEWRFRLDRYCYVGGLGGRGSVVVSGGG